MQQLSPRRWRGRDDRRRPHRLRDPEVHSRFEALGIEVPGPPYPPLRRPEISRRSAARTPGLSATPMEIGRSR